MLGDVRRLRAVPPYSLNSTSNITPATPNHTCQIHPELQTINFAAVFSITMTASICLAGFHFSNGYWVVDNPKGVPSYLSPYRYTCMYDMIWLVRWTCGLIVGLHTSGTIVAWEATAWHQNWYLHLVSCGHTGRSHSSINLSIPSECFHDQKAKPQQVSRSMHVPSSIHGYGACGKSSIWRSSPTISSGQPHRLTHNHSWHYSLHASSAVEILEQWNPQLPRQNVDVLQLAYTAKGLVHMVFSCFFPRKLWIRKSSALLRIQTPKLSETNTALPHLQQLTLPATKSVSAWPSGSSSTLTIQRSFQSSRSNTTRNQNLKTIQGSLAACNTLLFTSPIFFRDENGQRVETRLAIDFPALVRPRWRWS